MSKVEDFLTTAQEQNLIEAIKIAEKNTSGGNPWTYRKKTLRYLRWKEHWRCFIS